MSNPHAHGQIYATNFVFKTIETEAAASRRYYQEHRRVLFQDILRTELEDGRRVLFENGSAVAFLPYFARYAYECYVAPRDTHASLATMSSGERTTSRRRSRRSSSATTTCGRCRSRTC
jgi:UDPglucose--hexose-1-phosphate uridylyltransferase